MNKDKMLEYVKMIRTEASEIRVAIDEDQPLIIRACMIRIAELTSNYLIAE